MKSIRIAMATLFFSSLAYSAAHAAPLAILTGVKGAVQMVQGGKTTTGKNGATLEAGDKVQVGAGGAATVYYANRPPQTLGANQQMQVAAPGAATKPSVWSNVYKGVAAGFARRGEKVGGTVRGANDPPFARDEIVPLAPVNSRVMQRPLLIWALRNPPGAFNITLSDAEAKVLWRGQTKDSSLAIPAQTVLREGVRYYWSVISSNQAGEEKSSSNSWFEIAPAVEIEAARQEQTEVAGALKAESESTRRVAQASALAERGFFDEAIVLLTNRLLETGLAKTEAKADMRPTLTAFDEFLANMEEAARWQLRAFYADSGQIDLGNRIAPDLTAPAPATNYADEGGAFALLVPQGWTSKRDPVTDGVWLTLFSGGGPAEAQISVMTQPLGAEQTLETFGAPWLEQVLGFLRQNGTVKAETAQKAKFLGRDALRIALDYDSPDSGPQHGFLNVILGAKNAFLVGYSAPAAKPDEVQRLEAILKTLAIEAAKPLDN